MTATFLAKARIPNPAGTLLPGEYVKLERWSSTGSTTPSSSPAPAVAEDEAGRLRPYRRRADNRVAIRNVQAGQTHEGLRVVSKGLDAGVPVIVEGLQMIRPGIAVTAEPANGPGRPRRQPPRRLSRRPDPIRTKPRTGASPSPWSTSSFAGRSSPRSRRC